MPNQKILYNGALGINQIDPQNEHRFGYDFGSDFETQTGSRSGSIWDRSADPFGATLRSGRFRFRTLSLHNVFIKRSQIKKILKTELSGEARLGSKISPVSGLISGSDLKPQTGSRSGSIRGASGGPFGPPSNRAIFDFGPFHYMMYS